MAGGVIEYKCRRCGEVESSLHSPDVVETLAFLVSTGKCKLPPHRTGAVAGMHGTHSCTDFGMGVTDLIGGKMDDEGV